MTNAELIKAIRENEECNNCAISIHDDCNERKMSLAAADALEATGKKITELEKELEIWSARSFEGKIGSMAFINLNLKKEIYELEAQIPKEAHWVAVENGHGVCSNCNRQDHIDNLATHCRYCGARIKRDKNE